MGSFWVHLPFPPNFLFRDVNVISTSDLVLVCALLGALTFVSETLKTLRDILLVKATSSKASNLQKQSVYSIRFTSKGTGVSGSVTLPSEVPQMSQPQEKCWKWLGFLTGSTILHMIYVLLSYSLMLAVMSLNAYVFGALIVGSTTAHFLLLPLRPDQTGKK